MAIGLIKVDPGAQSDPKVVKRLHSSYARFGSLTPILLDSNYRLVFGVNRLATERERGATHVWCVILDMDEESISLTRLYENMCRRRGSVLEQSLWITEGIADIDTRGGLRGRGNVKRDNLSHQKTITQIGEELGLHHKAVQRLLRIGRGLAPEVVADLRVTALADNLSALLEIAGYAREEQATHVARLLQKGEANETDGESENTEEDKVGGVVEKGGSPSASNVGKASLNTQGQARQAAESNKSEVKLAPLEGNHPQDSRETAEEDNDRSGLGSDDQLRLDELHDLWHTTSLPTKIAFLRLPSVQVVLTRLEDAR